MASDLASEHASAGSRLRHAAHAVTHKGLGVAAVALSVKQKLRNAVHEQLGRGQNLRGCFAELDTNS